MFMWIQKYENRMKNKVEGNIGEVLSVNFLKKQGYKILSINFKTKFGEIDIIAQDKDTIVFVEVKRRETLKFGRPIEAIDYRKELKIKRVAEYYLKKTKIYEVNVRFDVIEILGKEISHIKNAFM